MLQRLGQFGVMIVATLFIWFSAAMVDVATASSWLTDAAVALAFLATMSIWIVQGLAGLESKNPPVQQEKAKRQAGEESDARLALLLQLLDDDERAALKRRLVNELSADGEAVPLADLLAAQEDMVSRKRGT
jgi:hypothetical protein